MATIEERAKRYCIENYTCKKTVHAYMGYVDGATEQRKIDIEKACEVYHKELSEIVRILNKVGKELYDIYELGEIISIKGSIKDFMKRMEE